jgi:hypothetical protein
VNKLVLSKTGDIANFIEWLERFKGDISKDSLIIEIDTDMQKLISKTFSDDKGLVRYSEISFKDAGFEITKKADDLKNRILLGIFLILPKFIYVVKSFETAEQFTMTIEYDMMQVAGANQWCATAVTFKSKSLKMKIPGSSVNALEMTPLSDDVFNTKVWNAPDPIKITVSPETLKNMVSFSDIFAKTNKMTNYMEFYTKSEDGVKNIYVRDPDQDSYDYNLGPIEDQTIQNDIIIPIYRERFLLTVNKAFDETTIIISSTNANRVLIELKGGNTKTIIAKVNR